MSQLHLSQFHHPRTSPPTIDQDEEALEKARLALHARSQYLREASSTPCCRWRASCIPVEILELEGEVALVRALPKLKDGRLIPQFPFPERKSFAQVLAKSLQDVKIYR